MAFSINKVEENFRILETSKKKKSDYGTESYPQREFQKCFQQWQQHRWLSA